jgi:hypothetical protein
MSYGLQKEYQIRSYSKSISEADQVATINNPATNEFVFERSPDEMFKNEKFQKQFKNRDVLK